MTRTVNTRMASETRRIAKISGSPAYVAKAHEHVVNVPEHGMVWSFVDMNAIQGEFRFEE